MNTSLRSENMVKQDPRITRSEQAIQNALLGQLRLGRSFSSLTVSEVADLSGVTRKTFYARFGSLEQLVERMVHDLFSELTSQVNDVMLKLPMTDNTISMMVFAGYRAHQSTLEPLIQHCPAGLFVDPISQVLVQLLDRAVKVNKVSPLSEVDEAYLVAMLASVVHGVLAVWAKRGLVDSPEHIASFVDALLVDGIQKVLFAPS